MAIRWTKDAECYVDKEYFYDDAPDLQIKFTSNSHAFKPKYLTIKNYSELIACEVLLKYPKQGRHFEDGILKEE